MKHISSSSPANRLRQCLESCFNFFRTLLACFGKRWVAEKSATAEVTPMITWPLEKGLQNSRQSAVALRPLALLPETLQANVLQFSGPLAWLHVSRTNTEMHRSLWEAPLVWSHALSNLGAIPGNPEREPSCLRDTYRHHFFGIDSFCLQPAVGCTGFCEVSMDLLQQALRACRGLEFSDGSTIITSVA